MPSRSPIDYVLGDGGWAKLIWGLLITPLIFGMVVAWTPSPALAGCDPKANPSGCDNQRSVASSNSAGWQTLSVQISSSGDDVNQTGSSFTSAATTVWFGGCGSPSICDTGLRFNGVSIPRGATIISAYLSVYSPMSQWNQDDFTTYGEASGNSQPFTAQNAPAARPTTVSAITHNDYVDWQPNTWYTLDDVGSIVQEIVSRSDWQAGNSLSIIMKAPQPNGNAGKTAEAFDGSSSLGPQLTITYQVGSLGSGQLGAVKPLPIISTGAPVYASSGTAAYATDNFNDTYWNGTAPGWLAYDLSGVPSANRTNVVVFWNNDSLTLPYDDNFSSSIHSQTPGVDNLGSYTVDANAAPGGGAPPASGWVTLVTVTGNTYHSRQHLVNLSGYNWVRINVTALDDSSGQNLASINFQVRDASQALDSSGNVDDDWIFYGASETAFGMHHDLENGVLNYSQLITQADPAYSPLYEAGAIGGITSTDGANNLAKWLAMFPGKYVILDFGGNDANQCVSPSIYYSNMASMVQMVINAKKVPIVWTIYQAQTSNAQQCGPALVQQIYSLYANYPEVLRGPDFWTFFGQNPQLISTDDNLHPTPPGYGDMRQMWRDTMLGEIYQLPTSGTATSTSIPATATGTPSPSTTGTATPSLTPTQGSAETATLTALASPTPTETLTASSTMAPTTVPSATATPTLMVSPTPSTTVTSSGCPCSIWPASATPAVADQSDHGAVEVGVKFESDSPGYITGLRFYKGPTNTGTHIGHLWTSSGTQLASVTFTNETASGWQQATFATPIAISANVVYVASYHTTVGQYAVTQHYFESAGADSPPLHALKSGASGANGVYVYTSGTAFPNLTYLNTNYWVDLVFATETGPTSTVTQTPTTTPTSAITTTPTNSPSVSLTATPTSSNPAHYVQSSLGYTGRQVPSQTVAFPSAVASGDLVVVAISSWNSAGTATVSSVSDNFGNSYIKAVEDPSPPTGSVEPLSIWYAANVTGGAGFTVTAELSAIGNLSVAVHEYSGIATTNVIDQSGHQSGSGTVASSGTAAPTTNSDDLLFGATTHTDGSVVSATAGSGYTMRQSQSDNGCCDALFTEDELVTSIGTESSTFAYAQSVAYRAVVIAFRAGS
jgi:lysophospholipase L1-like esterase